jgi:hypothetical protein
MLDGGVVACVVGGSTMGDVVAAVGAGAGAGAGGAIESAAGVVDAERLLTAAGVVFGVFRA